MKAFVEFIQQTPSDVARDQMRKDLQEKIRESVQRALKDAKVDQVPVGNHSGLDASDIQAAVDASQNGPGRSGVVVIRDGQIQTYSAREYSAMIGRPHQNDIPPQVPDMLAICGATLVCCVVGFPLARAVGGWIDRRGTVQKAAPDITDRLVAIEQAVETVAVEVERISEGQRFTTRVLSERTSEPAREYVPAARDAVPLGAMPANARRT